MAGRCKDRESCGVCEPASCSDVHENATACRQWSGEGHCTSNPTFMLANCSHSCGLCKSVCIDRDVHCSTWAKSGHCETNPYAMLKACPSSCGICHEIERDSSGKVVLDYHDEL